MSKLHRQSSRASQQDGAAASRQPDPESRTGSARFGIGRLIRGYRLDAFVLVCIAHALLVWRFWAVVDDAFISFRYARNLANGYGLRYNLGDHVPVEGYSNFLWVIVCSIFELFRMDITFWPALLSAACGTLLLWLVFNTLRRRLELSLVVVVLATLSLGCFPPMAAWATGGLATMPFALLVFVTFERLVLRREGADGIGGGIAGLLLALIRIEGAAWALVILVLALLSRRIAGQRSLRPFVVFVVIVVTGYAVYFGWRYSYYGLALPNTAYQKGNLDAGRLMRGVDYVLTHLLTFLTPALIVPGTLVALRRRRIAVGAAVAVMAWAFLAYAVLTTGDFMAMGRFLVPGLAFGTILFGWLLEDIRTGGALRRGMCVLLGAAAVVLGLLPGWDCHLVPRSVRQKVGARHFVATEFTSEYEWWRAQRDRPIQWARRGKALRSYAAQRLAHHERPSLVAGPVGAVGYYSGLYIFDRFGLVTAEVGRGAVRPGIAVPAPGHDKHVPREYFLKDRPTIYAARLFRHGNASTIAEGCRNAARQMSHSFTLPILRNEYGPDFVRVSRGSNYGEVTYLLTWTRLRQGQSARQAWADFYARLDALKQGGHLPPPGPNDAS